MLSASYGIHLYAVLATNLLSVLQKSLEISPRRSNEIPSISRRRDDNEINSRLRFTN